MRKNILILGHGYGAPFIDVTNQYTQLFAREDYEVTVVYLSGEANQSIRQQHLAEHVIFLNAPKKQLRGLKLPLIKKLLSLCRAKQFTYVICHRYKACYIMMWVALLQKIPRLFFVMHELGTFSAMGRKLLAAVLFKSNMIFAGVSNAVRDDIRRDIWRVPDDHVITLHNTIDVTGRPAKLFDRETARSGLNLSPEAFIFGNIGRLVKNKDQQTLIRAFALIKPHCARAKLVIAGQGELAQQLRTEVRQLNLTQDVIFTGFIPDGFRYMKAFDVYISSSRQEAFGLVLLEAMLAEVPVIATDVHGVPEVIGDSGRLIAAANPDALAHEMLVAYRASEEDLSCWGKRGYLRAVTYFSREKFAELFWGLKGL